MSSPPPPKAAPPAYQVYPKDEQADEELMGLTYEAYGLHERLCRHAWVNDGLPGDLGRVFDLTKGLTRKRFEQLWMSLDVLWPPDGNGRRRNAKQEDKRYAKVRYSEEQSDRARLGWEKRRQSEGNANAYALAVPVQCEPAGEGQCFALALALSEDLDPRALEQGAVAPPVVQAPKRRRMTPMRIPVWAVRDKLLAAVHLMVESKGGLVAAAGGGEVYQAFVDAAGRPLVDAIHEQLKVIAARHLHAEWQGRELVSILDAALGRRAVIAEAEEAREGFRRRDLRELRKIRTANGTWGR
jgi:hypothetical protein